MKKFLTAVFCLFSAISFSQTLKPGVLVVGGGNAGAAAAIQASRSGVKTILIEKSAVLGNDFKQTGNYFQAGLYKELVDHIYSFRKDSISAIAQPAASKMLKDIADTVKNLQIKLNTTFNSVKKSGKGWEIKLSDGSTVKTDVLIDATPDNQLALKAGSDKTVIENPFLEQTYDTKLFRTSVGAGYDIQTGIPYQLNLGALVVADQLNLISTGKIASKQSAADAMLSGQAAGATAAYCSFFKTTTKELNVRTIQSELFSYKSIAVPFTDIKPGDQDFLAIQHIGLTGILQGKRAGNEFLFQPDGTVSSDEIRQVFKEYNSRSQIWFLDKKIDQLSLGDLLSLLKYTASRGDELNREVERGWNTSFRFKGKFDLKHVISRREFAVLTESYLKPFTVRIDLNGKVGN